MGGGCYGVAQWFSVFPVQLKEDELGSIALEDFSLGSLNVRLPNVSSVRVCIDNASHPPVPAMHIIFHHDDKVINTKVSLCIEPLLSLMKEHNVIAFPMEPEGVYPCLNAVPGVPKRFGVSRCRWKDVVGGVR